MTAVTPGPLVIGLTGGIGAGKSTVAGVLGRLGMTVVDVDAIGRQVLDPDGAAHDRVIAHFGPAVVGDDGVIDRRALAGIVFGDPAAGRSGRLDELEAISHPAITETLAACIGAADPRHPVVLDMAVLAGSRLGWIDGAPLYRRVVVVEADLEVRLERLVARGMDLDDARSRIAAQPDDSVRRDVADVVVRNDQDVGTLTGRLHDLVPTIEAWTAQAAASPN
jgi:dephospho-CoA kinase